ncbi:MAG: 30S ribosomal protein S19 [Legionellaceae bacterium]
MTRSAKKGPNEYHSLNKKIANAIETKSKKVIETMFRAATILPEWVGLVVGVHNGKTYIPVYITDNMIGHKLGEFSITRNFRGHTASDKKAKGR